MRLPVIMPRIPEQRYSCHGCGDCCRDFTIELRGQDFERVAAQGWEKELGGPFWIEFAGRRWLRQREDGACIFLGEGGKCRIHAKHGLEAKPVACQLFPFSFAPGPRGVSIGVNFACGSVRRSAGGALASHEAEVRRLQAAVTEACERMPVADLAPGVPATEQEVEAVSRALDRWLADESISGAVRLEGFAWIAQSLHEARLERVRGDRLAELLDTLVRAAPDELPLLPATEPGARAWRLVRQAIFGRVEDPKIADLQRSGRLRGVLAQWRRSRAWSRGRGVAPAIPGWPELRFDSMNQAPRLFGGAQAVAIDELLRRWLRATVLGGRAWGPGLYGLPVSQGAALVALNAVCAAWLACARAGSAGRGEVGLEDLGEAIGRVDRASGRAPWLASTGQRQLVAFLCCQDSMRRAVRSLS
jgi:lysine-N-methylase